MMFHTTCCHVVPSASPMSPADEARVSIDRAIKALVRKGDRPSDVVREAAQGAMRARSRMTARVERDDVAAEDVAEEIADDVAQVGPGSRRRRRSQRTPRVQRQPRNRQRQPRGNRTTERYRRVMKSLREKATTLRQGIENARGEQRREIKGRVDRIVGRMRKLGENYRRGLTGYPDVEGLGFISDIVSIVKDVTGDDDDDAAVPFNPLTDPATQRAEAKAELRAQALAAKTEARAAALEAAAAARAARLADRSAVQPSRGARGGISPLLLIGGGAAALYLIAKR